MARKPSVQTASLPAADDSGATTTASEPHKLHLCLCLLANHLLSNTAHGAIVNPRRLPPAAGHCYGVVHEPAARTSPVPSTYPWPEGELQRITVAGAAEPQGGNPRWKPNGEEGGWSNAKTTIVGKPTEARQ